MTPVYLNPSSTSPFSPYNINIVEQATEEDLRLKLLNTSLPLPYESLASSSLFSFPTFFRSSDNQRTYGRSNTTTFGDQALLYYQRADDKLVWHGEPLRDQACRSETLVRSVVNVSSSDEHTDKINLEDHVRNIDEPRGSRLKKKTTSVMNHQIPNQKFQGVHYVDFQHQENNMGETSSNILAVSNNNSSGSSTTASGVRVCSDCSTSTTPLWRSGPRGPKSLCNACGIRQRKARRAMAEFEAAAAANVSAACTNRTPTVATTTTSASSMSKAKDKKLRGNHNSSKRKLDTASTASLTCMLLADK